VAAASRSPSRRHRPQPAPAEPAADAPDANVSNIFKYYVAYKLVLERAEERNAAKTKAAGAPQPSTAQ
jgi:hypothetical protein